MTQMIADTFDGNVSKQTTQRIGFIDLGSNSCRLCVVEYDKNGRMTVLSRIKNMVRLGEGAFSSKQLQPEAMKRTLLCLKDFSEIGQSYNVSQIVAVGTAALREANNRQAFVEAVKEQTGIEIDVISGEEEARLIRSGIFVGLPKAKKTYLFIDIGGGSTELSISNRDEIVCLESLNVGCVLVNEMIQACKYGKVTPAGFEEMMTLVESEVQHVLPIFTSHRFDGVIASSGTAMALLTLARQVAQERGEIIEEAIEGGVLTRRALEGLAKKLARMKLAERQKLSGISSARAEVIVAGAAVLLALMRSLRLKNVMVTESNLQDGQRIDFQQRHYPNQNHKSNEVREKHVKLLAKRYQYEKAHCRQVRRLAKWLYQGAVDVGVAEKDDLVIELLGYAARLHDIGISIAYDEHHQHGAYLVRYSHLLGFTEAEVETLAQLVYLHSSPSVPLPEYLGVGVLTNNVKVAAMCLYVAEMIDKTHRCVVENLAWQKEGKQLKLVIYTRTYAPIEVATKEKIMRHFKKIFRRTLTVEFVETSREN